MSLIESKPKPAVGAAPPATEPVTIIEPTRGIAGLRLRDIWEYRELLFFLVWRDVKVRYKQTALGVLWVVIQPVATMIVFNVFFHGLAKVPSEGDLPYPVFSFSGLLPWQFFSTALSQSANSLINSAALIRKVYFPRITIPIASSLSALVDFCCSFLVLLGLMAFYRIVPTMGILLLPLFLLLALLTVNGVGMWLSALSVQYRDVRYVVPFLLQFWLFATPVVYPSSLLSEPWRTLYGLNPMVGVVEGFRWALLGTRPPNAMLLLSTLVTLVLFVSGMYFFRQAERRFADVI